MTGELERAGSELRAPAEVVAEVEEVLAAVEEVVVSGEAMRHVNMPTPEMQLYEYVWDPVKGVHAVRRDGGVEGLRREGREPGLVWRDPLKASQSDRRVRVLLTATGQILCGVKNKWNKWVVQGVGVVDPVAYADVVKPAVFDFPWLKKRK